MFPAIILIRILFTTSMVFIIGNVFGNFSKTKSLATISKVATIMAIVLFIAANGILMRTGGRFHGFHSQYNRCYNQPTDSTIAR